MANVRSFEPADLDAAKRHTDASASIGTIVVDGEKFIQINTYGSTDRSIPGKLSQSIRLSKSAFDEIVSLGKSFF